MQLDKKIREDESALVEKEGMGESEGVGLPEGHASKMFREGSGSRSLEQIRHGG